MIRHNKVERLIWQKVSKTPTYQGNSREAQQIRNDRKELELSRYLKNRDGYKWVKVQNPKTKPVNIKTPKVLIIMSEILYGGYGMFHKLNWKPVEHDVYHNNHLAELQRCNLYDKYVSCYNRSAMRKTAYIRRK